MLLIVLAYMMQVHAVQRYSGRYLLSLNKGRAQVSILFPCTKTVRRPLSFSLCIAEIFMV